MPCVFLPHFLGSSVPFLVASAPSAGCSNEADAPGDKMGDAVSHQLQRNCSGLGVKILSKFHGGLAHFPQSNCSAVLGTTEELGQLATEATSGPDSETRPDNNEVDNRANKTVPVQFIRPGRTRRWLQWDEHSLTCAHYRSHKRCAI